MYWKFILGEVPGNHSGMGLNNFWGRQILQCPIFLDKEANTNKSN